ncbi:MAG: putative pectinesterase [Edaphobacter sp.]|nr:putative pectinesterase [Edaphobacter sp.]
MRTHLLLAAILVPTLARAQDVHVRVSPDVKTGIESTTEYPTIQMAMDHHPLAGPAPGKDGRPARVYIEIAPGTIFPNSFSLHRMEYGLP